MLLGSEVNKESVHHGTQSDMLVPSNKITICPSLSLNRDGL